MKIWGMGFMYGRCNDKSKEFIKDRKAVIGWSEKEAPDLYAMLREVDIGDIIYLKTYYIKNQAVKIWHIGKVVNTLNLIGTKYALGVEWIKSFDTPLALSFKEERYKGKNNVYNNTFYREYNPNIIQCVLNYTN